MKKQPKLAKRIDEDMPSEAEIVAIDPEQLEESKTPAELEYEEYRRAEIEFEEHQRRMHFFSRNNPSFPVIRAADLWKVPREKPEPLLENIIYPGSLTILAGDPKAGKSTFLFNAIDAMSHGEEFCGLSTRPATVLYASEQPDASLFTQVQRVPAIQRNPSIGFIPLENNFVFKTNQVLNPDTKVYESKEVKVFPENWKEQVDFWRDAIGKMKASLFVVDTFTAFAQFRGGETNDAGPTTQRLQQLKSLISSYPGLSIVVCHHLRKEDQEKGGDYNSRSFSDIANSYALRAATDMNVILYSPSSAEGKENIREIKVEGRFIEEPTSFQYKLTDRVFSRVGEPIKRINHNSKPDVQLKIRDFLLANPKWDRPMDDTGKRIGYNTVAKEASKYHDQNITENQVRVFREHTEVGELEKSLSKLGKF